MRNYVQAGDVLSLAAPYDRLSGQGALIGSIFGVAVGDVLSGVTGRFKTEGVFTLNKLSAQAWTVGVLIYWDDTNKQCTTVSTSNKIIGVAVAVAANPSATGVVRLNAASLS